MVKFGKHLLAKSAELPFTEVFVPYKELKKTINKCALELEESSSDDQSDDEVLDISAGATTLGRRRSHHVADLCIVDPSAAAANGLRRRRGPSGNSAGDLTGRSANMQFRKQLEEAIAKLNEFIPTAADKASGRELQQLKMLAEVNYTAIWKIVKKFEKKCGTNRDLRALVERLAREPFMAIHTDCMLKARTIMEQCVPLPHDMVHFSASSPLDMKLELFATFLRVAHEQLEETASLNAVTIGALQATHQLLFELGHAPDSNVSDSLSILESTGARRPMMQHRSDDIMIEGVDEAPRVLQVQQLLAPRNWMCFVPPVLRVWRDRAYGLQHFRQDIAAGVTIAIYGIPQGLAYAGLAGVPPMHGMLAVIFPPVVYALFSESMQVAVGPMSVACLFMGNLIDEYEPASDADRVLLMIALTATVGGIFFFIGLLRMGFLLSFVSKPVLSGFASGSGIITAVSVLKDLVGTHPKKSVVLHEAAPRLAQSLPGLHVPTLILSLIAVLVFHLLNFGSGRLKRAAKAEDAKPCRRRTFAFLAMVPVTLIFITQGIVVGGFLCHWRSGTVLPPSFSIDGTGATLPAALYDAVGQALACVYKTTGTSDLSVSYQPSGTGAGQRAILASTPSVDFAGMDVRPHLVNASDLLLIPTVATAVCPVVHLPAMLGSQLILSRPALVAIFAGSISHWNDPQILSSNPHLPFLRNVQEPIVLVSRADESGTSAVFQKALNGLKARVPELENLTLAYGGMQATGNSGMVEAVKATPYSIGYASVSAVHGGNSDTATCVALQREGSHDVDYPNVQSVQRAMARADSLLLTDLLDHQVQNYPGAWPISTYTYVGMRLDGGRSTTQHCEERQWLYAYIQELFAPRHARLKAVHGFADLPAMVQKAQLARTEQLLCAGDAPLHRPLSEEQVDCGGKSEQCAGISIIGHVPVGFQAPALPRLPPGAGQFLGLLARGALLAFACIGEHATNVKLYAAKHQYAVGGSRDLMGLGVSNFVGALFGAYVVGGSFTRSAINDAAGAKSQTSLLLSAGISALLMLLASSQLYYLPKAVLSIVVLFAVLKLVDAKFARILWKTSKRDFGVMFVAFVVTLFQGITVGLVVAVIASLAVFMWCAVDSNVEELARIPGTSTFIPTSKLERRNSCLPLSNGLDAEMSIERKLLFDEGVKALRITSALHFVNAEGTCNQIDRFLESNPSAKALVIDCAAVPWCDWSACDAFSRLRQRLHARDVKLVLAACSAHVRVALQQVAAYDHYDCVHEAVLICSVTSSI